MMNVRDRLNVAAWVAYLDSDGEEDPSMEVRLVTLHDSECDDLALDTIGATLEIIDGIPYAMEWRNVADIRVQIRD